LALPEPKPGLIVRYDYLWLREAIAGLEQSKDRPACLVAVSDPGPVTRFVVLLPITHAPPENGTIGIAIPARVARAIGLDDVPSWVIVSEYNVDEWPNGGLSPVPGRPNTFAYGFVPPGLFATVKAAFLDIARRGRSGRVQR
jgi:hypothetical protein